MPSSVGAHYSQSGLGDWPFLAMEEREMDMRSFPAGSGTLARTF